MENGIDAGKRDKKYLEWIKKTFIKTVIAIIVISFPLLIAFLFLWFYFSCYKWMVMAFPSFEVFPRWAFVLLLVLFSCRFGSYDNNSSG